MILLLLLENTEHVSLLKRSTHVLSIVVKANIGYAIFGIASTVFQYTIEQLTFQRDVQWKMVFTEVSCSIMFPMMVLPAVQTILNSINISKIVKQDTSDCEDGLYLGGHRSSLTLARDHCNPSNYPPKAELVVKKRQI